MYRYTRGNASKTPSLLNEPLKTQYSYLMLPLLGNCNPHHLRASVGLRSGAAGSRDASSRYLALSYHIRTVPLLVSARRARAPPATLAGGATGGCRVWGGELRLPLPMSPPLPQRRDGQGPPPHYPPPPSPAEMFIMEGVLHCHSPVVEPKPLTLSSQLQTLGNIPCPLLTLDPKPLLLKPQNPGSLKP